MGVKVGGHWQAHRGAQRRGIGWQALTGTQRNRRGVEQGQAGMGKASRWVYNRGPGGGGSCTGGGYTGSTAVLEAVPGSMAVQGEARRAPRAAAAAQGAVKAGRYGPASCPMYLLL